MNAQQFAALSLDDQVRFVTQNTPATPEARSAFTAKIIQGNFSEQEDPVDHLVVYFTLYHPETGTLLLNYNIATDLWLVPGGHVQDQESLTATLQREVTEELGIELKTNDTPLPFYLTLTNANSKKRPLCRHHLEVWFLIEISDRESVRASAGEAREFAWVPVKARNEQITDPATKSAVAYLASIK